MSPVYSEYEEDRLGTLEEYLANEKDFKADIEEHWKTNSFSFADCSDELRSSDWAIRQVAQYFPREVKNAHPDFLTDTKRTNEFMGWWFDTVVTHRDESSQGNTTVAWTIFFLNPDFSSLWIWQYLTKFQSLSRYPEELQTQDFVLSSPQTFKNIWPSVPDNWWNDFNFVGKAVQARVSLQPDYWKTKFQKPSDRNIQLEHLEELELFCKLDRHPSLTYKSSPTPVKTLFDELQIKL